MLDKLKSELGIANTDTSKDEDLNSVIDKVTRKALNYCNIKEIPAELEETLISMCVDLYKPTAPVLSMKKGDTNFTYGQSPIESLMNDYKSDLNEFRKVRW